MRKILTLIFILILLIPAIVWLMGLELDFRVERLGLKPPRLDRQALLDKEYYLSFDQYFNDNFSLRSPLIVAKRWLDYRLFHMTENDDIHVGTDGWLYSRQSIDSHRKVACDKKQDIEQLILDLHAIERLIEATGRRFLFIVAPNKSTIYPEFIGPLPKDLSCKHSTYDLFLEANTSNFLKNFVRLDQLLLNAKTRDALLYDPASRFWNARGAMLAAEAIHRRIYKDPAAKKVLDYKPIGRFATDDLKNELMGLAEVNENASVNRLRGTGQPDLPYAIVYANEFIQKQLPYLRQMFSRLDVIQADSFPSRQYKEDLSVYDMILLQSAESDLETLQIDIDRIFSVFEIEASLPARDMIDLKTARPVSNVSLELHPKGLQIKSLGHQSSFKLVSIPGSDDRTFRVLKLTMTTLHPDSMTIKFMHRRPYSSRKFLKPGLTQIYLPLPFQKLISLSIHPGHKAGVFMLRSAEILKFPDRSGILQPTKKKTIIAKAHPKQNVSHPQAELSKSLIQAGVKTDSSGSNSNGPDAEPNSKMTPSAKSESARSKTHSSEPSVSDEMALAKPEEITVSESEKKSETANSNPISDFTKEDIHNSTPTSIPAEVATLSAPAITLRDFENGRIFQRKNRSARVVVSGTYTQQIEGIEARVVKHGTSEEVVPWTVIDPSPRNGIFVGALRDVPQGGWYNLQVRIRAHPEISIRGTHKWGVGMLVACLGQSNMKEWFYTGRNLKAHPLLRKFNENGWSVLGRNGNAAIAFGNRIIDRLGIPVGLLDFAENGSGLRKEADWGTGYWADTSPESIYHQFISGASETGGMVEFVIWIQGEADAARGTVTEKEYAVSLEHFITNQVRMDIANGSDFENLPFLIVMMIKRPGGKDKPHQAIRDAQKHVAENVANSYLAATTLDLKNHGRQHLTPEAYITLGRRVSQTILHILGKETYHRGPTVNNVEQIAARTIEVRIQHRAGSDFTPDSEITGWEVIADGIPVPITKVYRHDPQTIRIEIGHPLDSKAKIRYLYGAMPDAKRPVLDNSPLSLPLEEYQAEIN